MCVCVCVCEKEIFSYVYNCSLFCQSIYLKTKPVTIQEFKRKLQANALKIPELPLLAY